MMAFLYFAFNDLITFIGVCILISVIGNAIAEIVKAFRCTKAGG